MKKIAIFVDSWYPEVNGYVTTFTEIKKICKYDIEIINPSMFFNIGCPTYKDIRLALFPGKKIERMMENFSAIHLTDEGPICLSARKICLKNNIPFTSSFHTNIPEYINKQFKLPSSWFYKLSKKFHSPSKGVLVPTKTMYDKLKNIGFNNLKLWTRGVDHNLFKPMDVDLGFKKPIFLYVGRISIEKNLESFLKLDIPGTKVLVGPGPQFNYLKNKYKDAKFIGKKTGIELVKYYAGADVFVFPSKSDVFGLVQLEALSCGLPVAAFPTFGPLDLLNNDVGVMNENLKFAILESLKLSKLKCREYALTFSWKKCTDIFIENLRWVNGKK